MAKKSEFENFCDELFEGQVNKVDYVRKQLQAKYTNNTDMYLAIKAEAQEDDYMQYLTIRVSILALVTSFFGAIINFIPNTGNEFIDSGINIIYLLLMIYAYIKIGVGDKYSSIRKWRKYVLIVIDDLIEESRK